MIVEYLRYRLTEATRESFIQAYADAAPYLRRSPHCLRYELSQCLEEPDCFILRIEWKSVEEHLQGFRQEPGFREFFRLVRPYLTNLDEMRHYQLTAVQGDAEAATATAAP